MSADGEPEEPDSRPGWIARLRARLGLGGRDAEADALHELFQARGANGDQQTARHERALVDNILRLRDLSAYDVMVPRADILCVPENVTLQQILRTLAEKPHSRVPVYRESLDDAIGMVHIKDVLAVTRRSDQRRSFRIAEILRPLPFIAPSMPVLDLLHQMRQDRVHMALVIDEFGGVDGLVTIEDLVETIVGEIADEHDAEAATAPIVAGNGTIVCDARMEIADFEHRFGPLLAQEDREEDIDTLGGLVFFQAGRVPGRGELVAYREGLSFEILEADPRRVRTLRVRGVNAAREAAA